MSGIYIHIPFCRQACHYCDFHFSTSYRLQLEMVEAICHEIELRNTYLSDQVETIYLGGGTPSVLSNESLSQILRACHDNFRVTDKSEVTIEANPDDLNADRLNELKQLGFNRLSIGVQSFDKDVLQFLNRVHTAEESIECIRDANKIGFDSISVDLIYGIPNRSHEQWRRDIEKLITLNPEHISAYSLTIEPDTAFGRWQKQGRLAPVEDDFSAEQFDILVDSLSEHGYEQYEVSNFCRDGHYSKHNTSYWQQKPYLGIGPSAHSYNIQSRQYNVANNVKYLKSIGQDLIPSTVEKLSRADIVNDYLLTTLRTKWGSDLRKHDLKNLIDNKYVDSLIENKLASIIDQHLILNQKGRLLADQISADLFIIDE